MKMLKCSLLSLALALGAAACSDDTVTPVKKDIGTTGDKGAGDKGAGDKGQAVEKGVAQEQGTKVDAGTQYNTKAKIEAFLEGKTLVMEGADIPPYPLGLDQNMYLEAATQCYHKVTMKVASGVFNVTADLGTLSNAPKKFDVGTCDRTTTSNTQSFSSTVAAVSNVASDGSCFDFDVTYPNFGQQGRGYVQADGKKVFLELYFNDAGTGYRCADGKVGAQTVKLTATGKAPGGDTVQKYVVQ